MENRFDEISVSFHLYPLSSCLSIDAFREEAPRPEILNRMTVPGGALTSPYKCGNPRRKQSKTG